MHPGHGMHSTRGQVVVAQLAIPESDSEFF